MKLCSMCKLPKERNEFYRNSRAKDGLQSRCKSCVKNTNERYSQTEQFKLSLGKYHKSSKGRRAKVKAQQKYEKTPKGKSTKKKYYNNTSKDK